MFLKKDQYFEIELIGLERGGGYGWIEWVRKRRDPWSGTKAEDRNQSKTDSKNYSPNQINK